MDPLNLIARFLSVTSILILFSGLFISLKNKIKNYKTIFILFLFLSETIGFFCFFVGKQSLFIFSFSCLIHFLFLTFFYFKVFIIHNKITHLTIGVSLLQVIGYLLSKKYLLFFQPYDRAFFSFAIMLFSLTYFSFVLIGKIKYKKYYFLFNCSVLLFFSIDAFLSLGTEFLIQQKSLILVAWFWFFRALLLQYYYVNLIYLNYKKWKVN